MGTGNVGASKEEAYTGGGGFDWRYLGYFSPHDGLSAADWQQHMAGTIRSAAWLWWF